MCYAEYRTVCAVNWYCFASLQSLFAIVVTSIALGTTLPFALAKSGVDPANAGTTIQVVMDVLGVAVTCVTCDLVLERLSTIFTSG